LRCRTCVPSAEQVFSDRVSKSALIVVADIHVYREDVAVVAHGMTPSMISYVPCFARVRGERWFVTKSSM
jgi:hypothetical protein